MNAPRLTLLLWLCAVLSVWAEPAKTDGSSEKAAPGCTFTAECQMIVVSTKQALQFVPELSDDTKILTAWPRVLEMIARGEAALSATLQGNGTEGAKLTTSSVEELRYATEFEPPAVPESFYAAPAPGIKEPASLEMLKNWPIVGVTPTAFDTRPVGQVMELEVEKTNRPTVLACRYLVQHTRFEKFDKIEAGRLANGEKLFLEQPRFSVMRDEGSTTFETGRPVLAGVHRLSGPEGKYELVILTLKLKPGKAP